MIGSDDPGSTVTLEVVKSADSVGATRTVVLVLERIANDVIADRRALFEIFAQSKDRALAQHDWKFASLVDACIEVWTKMYNADAKQNQLRAKHLQALQVFELTHPDPACSKDTFNFVAASS